MLPPPLHEFPLQTLIERIGPFDESHPVHETDQAEPVHVTWAVTLLDTSVQMQAKGGMVQNGGAEA